MAAVLVGAGLVVALQIGKVVGALPTLRDELALSLVTAGWVISAFYLLGAVFGVLLGAVIDRIGHRRCTIAGLVLVACCSALGAAAQGPALLLTTRVGEGLGFTVTVLAVPPLLVRASAAAHHGLLFGIWGAYLPTGMGIAIVSTPALLVLMGWRGLWVIAAVLAAAWAVLVTVATRRLQRPGTAPSARMLPAVGTVLRSPGPLLLAGVFAAYTAQFLAVFGFLPSLLIEQSGVSPSAAAVLTALAVSANLLGNVGGGLLRGRGISRFALIACASAVMAVAAVGIYPDVLPLAGRYGCAVVLSLVGGTIPATVLGGAPMLAPTVGSVATTVGLVQQGAVLGQAVGPPTVAAVATMVGTWQASPVVLGFAAAIAAGLGFGLRRFERFRPRQQEAFR